MNENNLLLGESLVQFFYKNLDQVNKNSICPLPHEFILYSSEVLNQYALSENFFNTTEGGVNEKILGTSFLEAKHKSKNEKKTIYKDVGDTALVQLGLFPKRLDKKHVTQKYYLNLGKSAYAQMENLNCSFYDIPNFYNLFSSSLEYIINLLSAMSEMNKFDSFEKYLVSSEDDQNLFLTNNKLIAI
jgi:hypothetical protein